MGQDGSADREELKGRGCYKKPDFLARKYRARERWLTFSRALITVEVTPTSHSSMCVDGLVGGWVSEWEKVLDERALQKLF